MDHRTGTWVCCQIGAREHFLVPAGLQRLGLLSRLITDVWVAPNSAWGLVLPQLRGRFHPGLDGRVSAFTPSALTFEARQRARGVSGWACILRRNEWFQDRAIDLLQRTDASTDTLFSYSYAGRRLFAVAKERRWKTMMVQIDAGPEEERLVSELHASHPGLEPGWRPAPAEYWRHWREEIDLADRIVVHSQWSRDALVRVGVNADKLAVIPLAYEPPREAASFERVYPGKFTEERPLRVLFLGQVVLRKGIAALLAAAEALQNEPIEFIVAGPNSLHPRTRQLPGRIKWIGAVPRDRASIFYREADVFLFPTQSDGFGLTQLEAQAWRLPVLATRRCGAVVEDGVNGLLLEDGSGSEIASVLHELAGDPSRLHALSAGSRIDARHQPGRFIDELLETSAPPLAIRS